MSVSDVLTSLWQPAHFYIGPGLRCAWQFEAEETLPWELFRGQLVSPTRERKTFLSWNLLRVVGGVVGEPILSLLVDAGAVHVTRNLNVRAWRPTDLGDGIVTIQTTEWTRELVGSVPRDHPDLAAEVQSLIRLAIVGTSRLPLTSLETPMPQFLFGQLMYAPRPLAGVDSRLPRRHWRELLPVAGDSRVFETLLRTTDESLREDLAGEDIPGLVRRMFNEISLSPYTGVVDRAFALLAEGPPAEERDVLSWLTRRITRHLTAYDLVLFHYRGANYPDALLLDALVRRMIALADTVSADRLARRALRMGCLVRAAYEGHKVPLQPTSPGEVLRVLPEPYEPDPIVVQKLMDLAADRELYVDEPLAGLLTPTARRALREAMLDLAAPDELQEGGIGLFIDRPLGFFKAPAEVDQTPLVSYVCFSRRLATRRLIEFERLSTTWDLGVPAGFWDERRQQLAELSVTGLPLERVPDSPRPAVSLADARKVSDDFVVLRSTPGSLRDFWNALRVTPGDWPLVARIMHENQPTLAAFDAGFRAVWLFDADWSRGSVVSRGVETPRGGVVPPYNGRE